MTDSVILVDAHDRQIGVCDKRDAHLGEGQLHRAFSVHVVPQAKCFGLDSGRMPAAAIRHLARLFWTQRVVACAKSWGSAPPAASCTVLNTMRALG